MEGSDKREEIHTRIRNDWMGKNQPVPRDRINRLDASLMEVLEGVLADGVDYYELKIGEEDYRLLVLSKRMLSEVSIAADSEGAGLIRTSFLGEFPDGAYTEEMVLEEGEIVRTRFRYSHPDLPDGEIKREASRSTKDQEELAPLRDQLRKWAAEKR